MPPHNRPALTLIETHRPTVVIDNTDDMFVNCTYRAAPLDYDRSPEPDTPVVFTGAEVWFAFYCGGFLGCMGTVGLAFVWSWFL